MAVTGWLEIKSLAAANPELRTKLAEIYKGEEFFLLPIRDVCFDMLQTTSWKPTNDEQITFVHAIIEKLDRESRSFDLVKGIQLGVVRKRLQEMDLIARRDFVQTLDECIRLEAKLSRKFLPSSQCGAGRDSENPHTSGRRSADLRDLKDKILDIKSALNEQTTQVNGRFYEELKAQCDSIWTLIDEWKVDKRQEITGLNSKDPAEVLPLLEDICKESNATFVHLLSNCSQSAKPRLAELLKTHLNRLYVVDTEPHEPIQVASRGLKYSITSPRLLARILGQEAFTDIISERKVELYTVEELFSTQPQKYTACKECKPMNTNSYQLQNVRVAIMKASVEKRVCVFQCEEKGCVLGINYSVTTLSAPIVLYSDQNDVQNAMGCLFWHAAFADYSGKDVESVSWDKMAGLLSGLFLKHTGSGVPVSQTNYLRELVIGKGAENIEMSKRQFLIDKCVPSRKPRFCFWKWFYAQLALAESLEKEWCKRLIYGFISKEDCEKNLSSDTKPQQIGCFILRFSENSIDKPALTDKRYTGQLRLAVLTKKANAKPNVIHLSLYLDHHSISKHGLSTILKVHVIKAEKKLLLNYVYGLGELTEVVNDLQDPSTMFSGYDATELQILVDLDHNSSEVVESPSTGAEEGSYMDHSKRGRLSESPASEAMYQPMHQPLDQPLDQPMLQSTEELLGSLDSSATSDTSIALTELLDILSTEQITDIDAEFSHSTEDNMPFNLDQP